MNDLLPILLSTDWLGLLGAITGVCTALVALFAFIPGDQPEKAIASLATLLAKFSRK